MAINTITYSNKEAINTNPDIPDINKVNAADMNEIKTVVNANANGVGDMSTLNTTATTIVGGINEINNSTIYSETEHVVGTWINDNPLYEKTIVIQSATLNAVTDYAHGISNVDFIFIRDIMALRTDNNAVRTMNAFVSTSSVAAQVNRTNLTYGIPASDWGWGGRTLNLYATVRYTKTTD